MPEKLSQSQIDALLNKMASGAAEVQEKPTQKLKDYDFRAPRKFTKEQLKALDGLHETLARVLASYFSSILRTPCEIEAVSAEEQRYHEYSNSLPDNTMLGLLGVSSQTGECDENTILLDLTSTFSFQLIDRLLGGNGKGAIPDRSFTDIEIAVLTNVLENITVRIDDVWKNTFNIDFGLESIESNPRLLQLFAPEDIVVITMMNIKMVGTTNTISICIPAELLEQTVDQFSRRFTKNKKQHDPEQEKMKKQLILENVCESELEMKAVFDEFRMPLREILGLQPMDVIPLHKPVNSDISIRIDDQPWFTAKLGETKKRKAIKLNGILNNIVEQTEMVTSGQQSAGNA